MTSLWGKSEKWTPAFGRIVVALGFALVLVAMRPQGARAAIGLVQKAATSTNSPVGSLSLAFNLNNAAGDLIVVAAAAFDSGGGPRLIRNINDSAGNTYATSVGPVTLSGTNTNDYIFYAKNIKRGANTVTVTFNDSTQGGELLLHEYANADTSQPLDVTASSTAASGTALDSGSATTTAPNELIFGYANGTATIPGAGFTREVDPNGGDISEDKNVRSAGAYNATFTQPSSGRWSALMATFKAGGGGLQASSRSDTLSDSRPSATSNHTVVFTANNAIYGSSVSGSSTLQLILDTAFSIPAGMDCGDVDAATSSQFNFNWPACQATVTAWGFSATGSVITLVPPTDTAVHVATTTQITIKIGSNATFQQQGIHWVTNPSTAGTYTVSVGGTFGGSGNMLVAILSGLTVQATVAESLSFTVSSVPAIQFVQGTIQQSGLTSLDVSFGANNSAGNLIVVGVRQPSTGTSSVSDSAGNTYQTAVGPVVNTAQDLGLYIFYAQNIKSGPNTVTVTRTVAGGFMQAAIHEYTGVAKSNALDITASSTGNGTLRDSGSAAIAQANELVFGWGIGGGDPSAGTGFTARESGFDRLLSEDKTATSAGSYNATESQSSSSDWIMQMATFKGSTTTGCAPDDSASVLQVNTTATSVPFGTVSANTFYQGCQDLIVATNAGGGYSVTVQENSPLKTPGGSTIPDTTCDAGNCTVVTGTAWVTPTNNGFGHTCRNQTGSDCNAAYSNGTKFKPLPNVPAGTLAGKISFVQGASGSGNSVTSVTVTFPGNTTNGNLIAVAIGVNNTNAITSVTDNFSNTYFLAASSTQANRVTAVYYSSNTTGGASHQITATVPVASGLLVAIQVMQGILCKLVIEGAPPSSG